MIRGIDFRNLAERTTNIFFHPSFLYFQVVLGFAFRIFDWISENYNIKTKTCYTVNRGYNLPPVESCEGQFEFLKFVNSALVLVDLQLRISRSKILDFRTAVNIFVVQLRILFSFGFYKAMP